MSNDDVAQQLKEWKQKYYESISTIEEQKNYEDLLQRSLGRLALAAQGLDSSLDTQLNSLRKLSRRKNNHKEMQTTLELMEKAIARMEVNKKQDKSRSSGEILANLLSSLKLKKLVKKDAKKLTKRLQSASNSEVSILMPELLSLLNSCLPSSAKNAAPHSGFSLFDFGRSKEHNTTQQDQTTSLNEDKNKTNNVTPIHLMLMQLLERLSLPPELSKQATKLRLQLEQKLNDEQLPQVIDQIAEIVSQLGTMLISEKQEYQAFLSSLTSRLNELDQHIIQTKDDNTEALKEREIIGHAVEEEVLGLRTNIEVADNLDQLKSAVTERLDFLDEHFDHYQKADQGQVEQSHRQILKLNQRIQEMEQETEYLRQSAEKSRDLALKDTLTGIWNRQALNELLEKEYVRWQRYEKPLSLIVWDVDFFKRVNDNYGHAAGDKVLRTIAGIFQKATRDADFIARFGGEEFMGIFPETELEDALILANKIRKKVEKSKFHYEDKQVFITASAGLATFRSGDTIDDVFKRADSALYQAKQSGRNRCISED
jgi:diguanylate cyclase